MRVNDSVRSERHPLASVFWPNCVLAISADSDRSTVLQLLTESLVKAGRLPTDAVDSVVSEFVKRETVGTTAMGKGLAFPHVRTDLIHKSVGAIGFAPGGLDFKSLDGIPTRLVFLLLTPKDMPAEHLAIMSRLARMLTDPTMEYLLRVPRSPEQLLTFLDIDSVPLSQARE